MMKKTFITSVIALLLALFSVQSAWAVNFTVTKTADTNDGVCDADCSLREAITAANTTPGDDNIILPAGTYQLTLAGANEDNNATGDLDILSEYRIVGAGAGVTIIDAGDLDRVFDLHNNASFLLQNVTVRNGTINDSGGGIYVRSGASLVIENSTISGNRSTDNEGGGGIYVQGSANLEVKGSTISGNESAQRGGGILNNNVAIIVNSTISGNSAGFGGGGIYSNNDISLRNVTITNNKASINGVVGGGVWVAQSTTFTTRNSIIAGNTLNDGTPEDCRGTLTSQGYNLIQTLPVACIFSSTTGDKINLSANLGPLQNNGGTTFTHALLSGSPAIDAGNPATPGSVSNACELTDQRGVTRPVGTACDMGAFEAGAASGGSVFLPMVFK